MKCLEKERGRRYETANALALEIQRYLADEPVLAGPPTMRYRLRKFVARHKGSVAAVSVILLCLLGGIIGTSVGLVWAMRERDNEARALAAETEAKQAAIQAGAAKERALAAETKARAAEQQARDKALAALHSLTDEVIEKQMARGTILTEENKAFLRKIIQQYEGFAAITADDAASRAIRAEGYLRVGLMRYRLGELQEAEAAYRDALAMGKGLVADFPARPEFRRGLASSHNNLGMLLKTRGRPKEAERAHTDALAIQKQLAAAFPTRPEFRQDLAMSYNNLGILLNETSRPKEAEKAFAEALAIQKQLAADFATRPEFRLDLARSYVNRGNMFKTAYRFKEAETAYTDARALLKQLADDFPGQPEFRHGLAITCDNLGALLQLTRRKDRLKDAEKAHVDALAIFKQLAAEFSTRPDFRQDLALSHNNLAGLLAGTGRLKEAEKAYDDALAIYKRLVADFPNQPDLRSSLACSMGNLAMLCNERRDFKAAKAYLEEALPHHQTALRANPRNPMYRQFLRNDVRALVEANAGLQDLAGALQAARKLRDLGWDPPGDAHYAAHALAGCIPVVGGDQQLDAAKRRAAVAFYGDEAMKMLRDAVGKGWENAALYLTRDPALAPLRQRDDFKKLLAEVLTQSGR
jgi:tetratricopeptide (TPR) repeat protein